jgi:protein required for attachment to host cells
MVRRNIKWVLVADGARVRVFVSEGPGQGVTELPDRSFAGSRLRSRDLGSDQPGRTFDTAGCGRHAMVPPSDPHRQAEREFLKAVVDWLTDQEQAGNFDHLVIIAPPRALGELRQLLPKTLVRKLAQEIGLDLTRAAVSEIEAHLGIPEAS